MTSQQSKFLTLSIASFSATLLFWFLELQRTSGLQLNPTFAGTARVPTSWPIHNRRTRRSSFAAATNAAAGTSDLTQDDENTQPVAYNWDEQFEELQKFMAEYGHCNFPQNPSKELKQKYPMLPRFCQDQRGEYKTRRQNARMTIAVSDREVRYRQLEQLGFAFKPIQVRWYDSYHELMEYSNLNGHTRVTRSENQPLVRWIYRQRKKRNDENARSNLSDFQIKLLNNIGFEWESEIYDAKWNEKYEELVAYRNQHGNFIIDNDHPLSMWIVSQRQRRAGKRGYSAISHEQMRLLDEIEFPWEPDRHNSMWFAMYDELKLFHKEHGHCRPVYSTHSRLYTWARDQKVKHRKGLLSKEQIELLNEIDFPFKSKTKEWPMMLTELTEYSNKYGHIQVNQKDDPDLYDWMDNKRQRYHDSRRTATLSDEQIEQLEDLHFCWWLEWRDRVWHEKYTEAVEYFMEHGDVSVTEKDNPSLYNWIQTQEKRYKGVKGQKPLSEEELEMLEQIDFPFLEEQPRMAWNAMYTRVTKYREENDGRLPLSHKDDPDLSRWLRHQRYRYRSAFGYAPLSDEQKELLVPIDFPRYPKGKLRQWYEMYDELVDFRKKHGHFLVDRSEKYSLNRWIDRQRMCYNGSAYARSPLSKLQVYLLERIGFSWTSDRNEVEWQQRYEELVEFLETQGHFPTMSENKRLSDWSRYQRHRYKGTGASTPHSESQIQQLEKIGFRWAADTE